MSEEHEVLAYDSDDNSEPISARRGRIANYAKNIIKNKVPIRLLTTSIKGNLIENPWARKRRRHDNDRFCKLASQEDEKPFQNKYAADVSTVKNVLPMKSITRKDDSLLSANANINLLENKSNGVIIEPFKSNSCILLDNDSDTFQRKSNFHGLDYRKGRGGTRQKNKNFSETFFDSSEEKPKSSVFNETKVDKNLYVITKGDNSVQQVKGSCTPSKVMNNENVSHKTTKKFCTNDFEIEMTKDESSYIETSSQKTNADKHTNRKTIDTMARVEAKPTQSGITRIPRKIPMFSMENEMREIENFLDNSFWDPVSEAAKLAEAATVAES